MSGALTMVIQEVDPVTPFLAGPACLSVQRYLNVTGVTVCENHTGFSVSMYHL